LHDYGATCTANSLLFGSLAPSLAPASCPTGEKEGREKATPLSPDGFRPGSEKASLAKWYVAFNAVSSNLYPFPVLRIVIPHRVSLLLFFLLFLFLAKAFDHILK